MRKPGKLPADRASVFYELEYGSDSLELHRDPSVADHRVVIVDDLLATGGTIAGLAFVIELEGRPQGRPALEALLHYKP